MILIYIIFYIILLPLLPGSLLKPSSLILFLRTPTLPLPLHFLSPIFWCPAPSLLQNPPGCLSAGVHKLQKALVKETHIPHSGPWSVVGRAALGLLVFCCELGALLSARHSVRRQHLTEHSDTVPFLSHPDLISFWCSYAKERLERGERNST